MTINCQNNKITVSGNTPGDDFRIFCACLHGAIVKSGYQDIVLDFSQCTLIFESFMLSVIPIIAKHRQEGIDFDIILPCDSQLQRLFLNTNWAHFLNPEVYPETDHDSPLHLPASHFSHHTEQYRAVDRIMELILNSLDGLNRGQMKALEWSLNEITDNVLNHSHSPVGGYVQATTYSESKRVEFIVADAGMGIPKSLGIKNDTIALERAIQEGVTRNKSTNQGNGLFGSYRVAVFSNGEFEINSSRAFLSAKGDDTLKVRPHTLLYPGTSVRCLIDCTRENLLEEALRFEGKPHDPAHDFIERKYEGETGDNTVLKMRDHTASLGSREAGEALKNKIKTLLKSTPPGARLEIDFDGIVVVSSSFADEVLGMLFKELGPMTFMSMIELKNVDRTVRGLIDKAITKRMAQSQ